MIALPPPPPHIEVTVAPSAHAGPLTGRLIVFLAKDSTPEPRLAMSMRGPAVFGVDLDQLAAGQPAVVGDSASGYPVSLSALPPGDYYAQAMVNVYEQVHRSDGHTIWVHLNDGTVEFFNTAVGNLYSDVQRVHVGGDPIQLTITHVIPAKPRPADTEWIKHVRVQSDMLTKFWGHPVYIKATLVLPKGYAQHPNTYYPSVYALGHAPVPFGFSPDSSERHHGPTEIRRGATIDKTSGLESGYDFYQSWVSDDFPRVIAITLEQETPYFPDSYSVNSANNGPYGDAVINEVIPYLETHFRIIRQPYARQIEGASTSGWQTLALALQHPDVIGGAWVLQPDPIDFRHYQQTNAYQDTNAFVLQTGPFTVTERPFQRTVAGQVLFTARDLSRFEDVLGSHGRSGYQLEAWEAVYGPVGDDGYPVPLWNKRTGTIDHAVAAYMRDHGFDLREYAERNWSTLGPKLAGKLHFFAGDMDNYYLNLAVYDFEDFLKGKGVPTDFTYGRPEKGHGWHSYTWAEMIRKMATRMKAAAPAGANSRSWNY
jgi:Putative esterase